MSQGPAPREDGVQYSRNLRLAPASSMSDSLRMLASGPVIALSL